MPVQAYCDNDQKPSLHLSKGKTFLDNGDFTSAVTAFTAAYEQFPLLADYALFWRAAAYEKSGDSSRALNDIRALRDKFPDTSLIKKVRRKEIELSICTDDAALRQLYSEFIRDFPSETEVKYAYALYLKKHDETKAAKKIFKEVFASTSSLSANALKELGPSDLTAEDYFMRGKNLSSAWLFKEAEKNLREALDRGAEKLHDQILDSLAYTLFRQKHYNESAELYRQVNNHYWRARSMLRAGEIEAFENELPIFVKTSGNRIAPVLIAYAMKKRRDGDINESLETLQRVLADYPSVREEALWAIGWTQYIAGDYEKARETLSQMTSSYTDPRYVYWKTKCSELLGDTKSPKTTSVKEGGHRDFYAILSLLKDNRSPKKINRNALKPITTTGLSEKTDALAELGFKSEAVFELIYQARRSTEQRETIAISAYLKRLGEEKMSINIVTKVPYREEIHELYYPLSYWAFVEEAAGKNGVDPLLVLSVIREESRFDPQARSIAGALGLMQLMPQTAARFSRHALKAHKLPANLQDARLNIQIGTYYLSQLLKTFQSIPPALAAYNAGEDAVKSWLSRGNYKTVDEFIEDIPYDETRNYVKRVLNTYFEYLRASEGMDLEKTRKQLGAL